MVGFQIKSALCSCPPALKMVSVPVSITLLAKSLKSVSVTCIQHAKFIYLNMRSYPGRWPGLCSNCLGCPLWNGHSTPQRGGDPHIENHCSRTFLSTCQTAQALSEPFLMPSTTSLFQDLLMLKSHFVPSMNEVL